MKEIRLNDIWAVTYCVTAGVALIRLEPSSWPTFILDDTDGRAGKALGQWSSGCGMVNAKHYSKVYRQMKTLLWDLKKAGNR